MSVLPEIVKHLVDELAAEFSESRKAIESMDEDVFKTWVEMLLRAA